MRIIDTIKHQLTGIQILSYLARNWEQDSDAWLILMIERGREQSVLNTIRVSLSKERKSRHQLRNFELRAASVSQGKTQYDIECDYLVIGKVHGGRMTQLQASMAELFSGGIDSEVAE